MELVQERQSAPVVRLIQDAQSPPIIDEVSTTLTYIGISKNRGAQTSSKVWQIKKIEKIGTVTTIEFPSSNSDFNFDWDSRATFSYSR